MKIIGASVFGVVLALTSGVARATLIPYTIELTPSAGPAASGSFEWDDSTSSVTNFLLTLGQYGPFAGGDNDGAPVDLGPVFDGSRFTSQVAIHYAPYFDPFFLNTDGTYQDFNGRLGGGYTASSSAVSVPEPATLGLLGVGLLGLVLSKRRKVVPAA